MSKFDEIEQYVRGLVAPGFWNVIVAGVMTAACAAGFYGWCANIAAVFSSQASWWEVGLRLVGITFWPLGIILGWLQ
jgi:hypothetical protein